MHSDSGIAWIPNSKYTTFHEPCILWNQGLEFPNTSQRKQQNTITKKIMQIHVLQGVLYWDFVVFIPLQKYV